SWLNDDELIFALKSPVLPGDIWRYGLKDEMLRRLTSFGRSETIEHLWQEAELYTFRSFDGVEVPYFYYRPAGSAGQTEESRPAPTVVYVHGGPESQIRFEFHPVIQYLVGQGFNVVTPNVRGSMGYGKTYLNLDNARKRMDAVADLAWMVKDLSRFATVDTGKIGIMGRSYGGVLGLGAAHPLSGVFGGGGGQ
ncbi:peptidase S9, partial [Paenibacillus sp. A3]|uniref:alpha/beta hydrolase family protein n=1 Tax=Paenibacillus sp. A3 TaxID=1337054 RepID=UPI0006E647F5